MEEEYFLSSSNKLLLFSSSSSSSVVVVVVVSLLYFVARSLYYLWWKPKRLEKLLRKQGFKGNAYRFLIGDMIDEVRAIKGAMSRPMDQLTHRGVFPRAVPFLHQTMQRYGEASLTWTGATPKVVISDIELASKVFLNKSGHVNRTVPNPFIGVLSVGVLKLNGQELTNRRKIITTSLHLEKLRAMAPAFQASSAGLIRRWGELACSGGGGGDDDGGGSCEVDVWEEFLALMGEVISQTAFGSDIERGKKCFQLLKEQQDLIIKCARLSFIPGFRFMPAARKIKSVENEMRSLIREMIDEKSIETKGCDSSTSTTILGSYLQFMTNPSGEEYRLTVEDVIDECKILYLAGQGSTTTLLTWSLVCLSMDKTWQHRAREEIFTICGKDAPNFETISHLKTVTMILYEVLRLYPIVTDIVREAYEDIELGGLSIPAGTRLHVPVMVIQRDPRHWGDDAEEFNPARFSEGTVKATKGNRNAYFPFGWGERMCPGNSFALTQAKMTLAAVLQNFWFELSPSYTHAPCNLLSLQPQHGAHIILHRLN